MNSPAIPTYIVQGGFGVYELHLLSGETEIDLLLSVYTEGTLPHNIVFQV